MADCRDWASTLRRASFRGVDFFVEQDTVETGRRLVVHEYPHRDLPYIEDLGMKANRITVSAYVTGDDVESREAALRAACSALGPGALIVPMGRFAAHCETCSRDFTKDRLGYVAFNLQFVREGTGAGPFPLGGFLRALEFGLSQIIAPLKVAFSATFSTIGQPGFVPEAAAARVREAAVAVETARRRLVPKDAQAAADLKVAVVDLYANAVALTDVGSAGNSWSATSFLTTSEELPGDDLVDAVSSMFALVTDAGAPDEAERALRVLLDFGTDWTPPTLTTDARRREAANEEALSAMVRVSALTQWVRAMMNRTYPDRPSGKQALADVAEYIELEMERITIWSQYDVYRELANLRKLAVDYFNRLILDLAPVQTLDVGAQMPSLYWAYRLYADAERAREIADRNGVYHPSFIPTTFEALAK